MPIESDGYLIRSHIYPLFNVFDEVQRMFVLPVLSFGDSELKDNPENTKREVLTSLSNIFSLCESMLGKIFIYFVIKYVELQSMSFTQDLENKYFFGQKINKKKVENFCCFLPSCLKI